MESKFLSMLYLVASYVKSKGRALHMAKTSFWVKVLSNIKIESNKLQEYDMPYIIEQIL